ncbi:cytochrome c biogenesis protein CcsA [Comamonas sp. Sa2CVA6]|uniref:Cytochrome c biogenesis protein CcsA n=2 Tax=Comamonas avium TaxID=2762231 RepID=A0ABR8SBP6_9BURK|nr:cytochrome c biogenesis protein CcsA [Comamonas avium]
MIAGMESSTHIFTGSPTWVMALAMAAIASYLIPVFGVQRMAESHTRLAMRCAWVLHLLTVAAGLMTTPARFGFAPALSMTAWLMLTVYAIEQQLYPKMRAVGVLSVLGALTVLLAQIFPGKPMALQTSAWLPLHLALGIASYGLCAAAVVHAGLMSRAEHRMRTASNDEGGMPLLMLERLTFRFVTAGFVLLSATLLAGLLFGESLYGRAWVWDHKTVFSLLAWVAFALLLIGRSRFGLRGRHAVHLIYAGAALLLLAYAGSRFVLEVVMLGRLS